MHTNYVTVTDYTTFTLTLPYVTRIDMFGRGVQRTALHYMYAHMYCNIALDYITVHFNTYIKHHQRLFYITVHAIPYHTIQHITLLIQMQYKSKCNQIHIIIHTYLYICLRPRQPHLPAGMFLTRCRRVVWLLCAPCSSTKQIRFETCDPPVILRFETYDKLMLCLMHGLWD